MDQHSKLGYREGLVSVILNLLLFVLKYYAGIASASLALIADAWHTLSDSLTSLVVILGIKLSSKKPDKEHPFGHGRWEQISALIIAILLALIGVEFMKDAIAKLRGHEAADFGWLAYLATVASIVLKEGLARYAFYIARKTGRMASPERCFIVTDGFGRTFSQPLFLVDRQCIGYVDIFHVILCRLWDYSRSSK